LFSLITGKTFLFASCEMIWYNKWSELRHSM